MTVPLSPRPRFVPPKIGVRNWTPRERHDTLPTVKRERESAANRLSGPSPADRTEAPKAGIEQELERRHDGQAPAAPQSRQQEAQSPSRPAQAVTLAEAV